MPTCLISGIACKLELANKLLLPIPAKISVLVSAYMHYLIFSSKTRVEILQYSMLAFPAQR